jgi:apolipoprotein N-acyltransferase
MTRSGWYAALTALLGGLAAGFAHPPFGVLPGLLGYALILLRIDGVSARPLRSAFGLGWLAGLGYFGVSTWWIAEPFLVDERTFGWMAPFAVVLMGGGLALFWGAAAWTYRALRPAGAWKVLVFAGVFAGAEWLRGHLATGFPWNLPGETWLTLAISAAPAVLMLPVRRLEQFTAIALGVLALTGLYAAGGGRLAAGSQGAASDPDAPVIRIVQANIDQKTKWKAENLDEVFSAYETLTRRPAGKPPLIVVWPEGALPAVIDELIAPASPYRVRLLDMLSPGQTLLMGANRIEPTRTGTYLYFNTLIGLRREGSTLSVVGVYDKHRLVPFGEFLPFGPLATTLGLRSLAHMPEDFTAGPRPAPLALPGLPSVQPLICYEALFPELAATTPRSRWILNVSNDAWFGAGSGPLQHLNIASYRAIEQGLPLVRATPTGVSAVIDAYGRVRPGARLDLNAFGVIDARLPKPLSPTLYGRYGDLWLAVLMMISGFAAWRGRRPSRPQ